MNNQELAFKKLSVLKVGALFMEMGSGKTKVALDLISSKKHKVDYILWICPFSLKTEIEAERIKWHPDLSMDIIGCESIGSSNFVYLDLLRKVENSRSFIIVDESLKIKNREAKRTQRILKLGETAKYKLILNGTPISKDYCDLWTQMQFLSPKILKMSFNEFFNTYCEYFTRGKYKGKIKGFVNIPHLIDKINPYVFDSKLEIDTKKKYENRYYSVDFQEYTEYKERLFDECSRGEDFNFHVFSMKLQKFYTQNSDRQERLNELIEEINDKVIIFVRFLASIPEGVNKITGAETTEQRKQTIEDFKSGKFNILYITYGCGAFGLNLQFCQNMIFAEHTWDYAIREQAEARIYRIGQKDEVKYYDFICEGVGLEELISNCLSKKSNMLVTIKQEIEKRKGDLKEWAKYI